ncbi:MAG: treY [Solirubrobacterales bacterium]|nr:treY [Solirubrobacterales bacterium]
MKAFRATYRLQLGPGLGFAEAQALLPYLDELGISHLYLSPVWQARPGSTHGYDVVEPAAVSKDLGGEAGLRALSAAARERGMGLLLDVVPNHMATDDANPYWSDPVRREQFFDVDAATGHHRRFFDIDELAGVRQEDPEVFAATHAKVVELVADGVADGIRVDHPDGMSDPAGYLRDLREAGVAHVWVEKILENGEVLRPTWPTEGTTGYEFCVDVQGLFVDPAGEAPLTELWTELSGDARPFSAWADEAKAEQASTTFTREVERLQRVADVPGTLEGLSALHIYRTYVDPVTREVSPEDREAAAVLPDAVRRALLLEDEAVPAEWVVRFQQTSSPVMAKGVEDTAFYRYLRLLALNEVGGDPGRFSLPVAAFHDANAARAERYPHNLLATSTHDTKRSGDARARLGVLAGLGQEWAGAVRRWRTDNVALRASDTAPTATEELLIYQTLISVWPIEMDRLEPYLIKAMREAKQGTNWIEPDEAHERAVLDFAAALLEHGPFRYGFDGWAARVADAGARAALGQTLLKLTSPGVPDVYQGDETLFLALVDPDNRREVDWDARHAALDALRAGEPPAREHAKLHLVWKALRLRAELPAAFTGTYTPIPAGEGVCAFLRGEDVLVAVAVRDTATGAEGWALPAAAAGRWRSVLDDAEHELPDGASLASVLGPDGRALLRRA